MNETTDSSISSERGGRVLVLAPDENLASAIRAALQEAAPDAQVDIAHSLEEAQHLVVSRRPDLFVLDAGRWDQQAGDKADRDRAEREAERVLLGDPGGLLCPLLD
ncbi:MAG: hypothetical protein ABR589_13680, partial [Chthoniobacterales bacterium]